MLIDETERFLDDDGLVVMNLNILNISDTTLSESDLAATSSAHLSLNSKEFQHKIQKLSTNNFLPVSTNAPEFKVVIIGIIQQKS